LELGQDITFVAGVRVESETNEYRSRFVPGSGSLGGFPTPSGETSDTTYSHTETAWLPNVQIAIRPTDYLTVRMAAYQALARPDYNMRLVKLYALAAGSSNSLIVGNPKLKNSKAWNFEVNSSVYNAMFGLVSVSAYYKEIENDIHTLNAAGFIGRRFLDSLGIKWNTSLTSGGYLLTAPYNASAPTKIWGVEFEHQALLNFLPGYLQNIVLSYNFSLVRSETHLISTRTDTTRVLVQDPEFGDYYRNEYSNRVVDRVQKLEGQPEFYGNVAIGYDIAGFSARLSVFYQGEFNSSFSPNGWTDGVTGSFSKWDLTAKQKVTDNVSVLLSVSNLLDIQEDTYSVDRVHQWTRLNSSQKYGLTADFGVRIDL
jgi:TonB-dependent receptor